VWIWLTLSTTSVVATVACPADLPVATLPLFKKRSYTMHDLPLLLLDGKQETDDVPIVVNCEL
jgi:hypothetical protein